MSEQSNAGLLHRVRGMADRVLNRDDRGGFKGIQIDDSGYINTDLIVKFDPSIYGTPEEYCTGLSWIKPDCHEVSFRAKPHDGTLSVTSHSVNLPDSIRELAVKRVEKYVEETPRDEWPHNMQENFEGGVHA